MIKLVFCLRRRPELSREEFQRYWKETHAPLVRARARAIGALRYVQVHTGYDDLNAGLQAGRGGPTAFDGVAELWFEDRASLEAALKTDAARKAGPSCSPTNDNSSISRNRPSSLPTSIRWYPETRSEGPSHQPAVPGPPLNGPRISCVIHPP